MAHTLRSFFVLLLAAALILLEGGAAAAPEALARVPSGSCAKIDKRQEWDALPRAHRLSYIRAVKCMMRKPGIFKNHYGLKRLTRYEDFIHRHKTDGSLIHFVGHFLPWHRYFIHIYEKALKEECGYVGVQPYWDASTDVEDLRTEEMWDDTAYAFGGDGEKLDVPPFPPHSPPGTGGGCILNGPFKNLQVRIPPRNEVESAGPVCVTRNFNTWVLERWGKPSDLEKLLVHDSFWPFANELEGGTQNFTNMGIHGSGHAAVGGTMSDPWISPSDPIFFLHHGNVDRIWYLWQRLDWEKRSTEIGGTSRPFVPRLAPNYYAIREQNITLDWEIPLNKLAPTVKVADVMDTRAYPFCYEYE